MTLTVGLTPEEEVRLAAIARAQGVPIRVFVRNVLGQVATHPTEDMPAAPAKSVGLPSWPGSVISQLRLEGIYEVLR